MRQAALPSRAASTRARALTTWRSMAPTTAASAPPATGAPRMVHACPAMLARRARPAVPQRALLVPRALRARAIRPRETRPALRAWSVPQMASTSQQTALQRRTRSVQTVPRATRTRVEARLYPPVTSAPPAFIRRLSRLRSRARARAAQAAPRASGRPPARTERIRPARPAPRATRTRCARLTPLAATSAPPALFGRVRWLLAAASLLLLPAGQAT